MTQKVPRMLESVIGSLVTHVVLICLAPKSKQLNLILVKQLIHFPIKLCFHRVVLPGNNFLKPVSVIPFEP